MARKLLIRAAVFLGGFGFVAGSVFIRPWPISPLIFQIPTPM
jgi:hypothetical protein